MTEEKKVFPADRKPKDSVNYFAQTVLNHHGIDRPATFSGVIAQRAPIISAIEEDGKLLSRVQRHYYAVSQNNHDLDPANFVHESAPLFDREKGEKNRKKLGRERRSLIEEVTGRCVSSFVER